jgi:hypothetical protein
MQESPPANNSAGLNFEILNDSLISENFKPVD